MSSRLPAPASAPEVATAYPVFVHGPILVPSFVSRLLEHRVVPEPARLLDFVARDARERGVEVLVASPGDSVPGWLLRNLNGEDVRRLDAYNGVREDLYRRELCLVKAQELETTRAWVYLPTDKTLQRCFSWDRQDA